MYLTLLNVFQMQYVRTTKKAAISLSIFGYTLNKTKLPPEQIMLLELVWSIYY